MFFEEKAGYKATFSQCPISYIFRSPVAGIEVSSSRFTRQMEITSGCNGRITHCAVEPCAVILVPGMTTLSWHSKKLDLSDFLPAAIGMNPFRHGASRNGAMDTAPSQCLYRFAKVATALKPYACKTELHDAWRGCYPGTLLV